MKAQDPSLRARALEAESPSGFEPCFRKSNPEAAGQVRFGEAGQWRFLSGFFLRSLSQGGFLSKAADSHAEQLSAAQACFSRKF